MKNIHSKKIPLAMFLSMILLIIIFFVSGILSYLKNENFEYRMFNSISSFEVLNEYVQAPIESDKYLDDLVPIDYFRNVVKWNGKKYEVYAYVFSDVNQCHEYIKKRTNISFIENKYAFSRGNLFFATEYIVFMDNMLLYIDGPGYNDMYSFLNFLQQDFDVEL